MPERAPSPLWTQAFDDAAIAASGRRARALWAAESAAERDRLLRLPPAPDRLAALDREDVRELLTPAHRLEVLESISRVTDEKQIEAARRAQDAEEREARRRKWEAERLAALHLDRLRPWALCLGIPLAAGLPVGAALGIAGWGPIALLVAALEVPWLPWRPTLGVVAALCGVGFCAWLTALAQSVRGLEGALAGAFAAGALAVVAARFLPVYVADPGARMADGSSMGGSVVHVERLWPAQPDRLHILAGNARLSRGMVLELSGGQPERYLRGG